MGESTDELIALFQETARKWKNQIEQKGNQLRELIEVQDAGVEALVEMALDARQDLDAAEKAGKMGPVKETLAAVNDFLEVYGVAMKTRTAPKVTTFLAETYTEEKRLRDDANRHVVNYLKMFAKITADKPMNTYERKDIVRWVRTLERLKNSIGKSPKDAAKPITQLLAESKGRQTLNETSINKRKCPGRC